MHALMISACLLFVGCGGVVAGDDAGLGGGVPSRGSGGASAVGGASVSGPTMGGATIATAGGGAGMNRDSGRTSMLDATWQEVAGAGPPHDGGSRGGNSRPDARDSGDAPSANVGWDATDGRPVQGDAKAEGDARGLGGASGDTRIIPVSHELPPPGEQIVFEVRYSNHAWGDTSAGYFITRSGQIVHFDYYFYRDAGASRYPTLPANPSHADLLTYFGAYREPKSQIESADVEAMLVEVPGAAGGVVVCASTCMDAGGTSFIAWELSDLGVYSPVDLGGAGDQGCKNVSPDAQRVVAWLSQITGMGYQDSCGFPDLTCSGSSCDRDAGCRSAIYCASVPDCGWCTPGLKCVQSAQGTKHCIQSYDCRGKQGCRCYGDGLCGGGLDHCRDLDDNTMTCVP